MAEPHPSYGPRERILHLGECRLSDAECLALILRTGRRGETAEEIGQRLLRQFGGLSDLASAEVREVAAVTGVGPVRAASLGAAFGLARRLMEVTDKVRDHLGENGFDPVLGARPLRRLIQNEIKDLLSEELLSGRINEGDTVIIDFEDDIVTCRTKEKVDAEPAAEEPEEEEAPAEATA